MNKYDIEQERAAFEAWFTKIKVYIGDPKDIFTQVVKDIAWEAWKVSAALQSQNAEDAERYRYLRSIATQQADHLGPIFRIDVRRTSQTLFNFDAAVDRARRVEGRGE